jgi:predicted secreted hydrolase
VLVSLLIDTLGGVLDSLAGLVPYSLPPVVLPGDERWHTLPAEWWYLNGHLTTTDGSNRTYGFETTVVRVGDPLFGVGLAMFGFFAVVDVRRRTYEGADRLVSPSAYAETVDGFTVALPPPPSESNDWTLTASTDGGGVTHYALDFRTALRELQLTADEVKSPVLHGTAGIVDFGGDHAMAYYSRTRLSATGTLHDGHDTRPVDGTVWMDHQWGPARFLDRQWKFFAVQLDGGEELFFFRVARRGSDTVLARYGAHVDGSGTATVYDPATVEITDPATPLPGGYPIINRIRLTGTTTADLLVTPYVANQIRRATQPHALYPPWWEGACRVTGTFAGTPVSGRAYVELGGYETQLV